MKQTLGKLFAQMRGVWRNTIHRPRMEKQIQSTSDEYTDYLAMQLRRTLQKNDNHLKNRTVRFVDKLSQITNLPNAKVLSVGCRNHAELDYFIRKGVEQITGIDLYSTNDDILVMDMHKMTFHDNEFDIVYSSHSLEHAYDIQQAANEFIRVCRDGGIIAIEMPIEFEPRGSDLVDIGNIDNLSSLFSSNIKTILWHEHVCKESGKSIPGSISTIFEINKALIEQ